MDSVSNGLSRKVALEFGMNHATVSMSSSYLSPDYSGFVRFSTRSDCVLCFVHISTSLDARIAIAALATEQSVESFLQTRRVSQWPVSMKSKNMR